MNSFGNRVVLTVIALQVLSPTPLHAGRSDKERSKCASFFSYLAQSLFSRRLGPNPDMSGFGSAYVQVMTGLRPTPKELLKFTVEHPELTPSTHVLFGPRSVPVFYDKNGIRVLGVKGTNLTMPLEAAEGVAKEFNINFDTGNTMLNLNIELRKDGPPRALFRAGHYDGTSVMKRGRDDDMVTHMIANKNPFLDRMINKYSSKPSMPVERDFFKPPFVEFNFKDDAELNQFIQDFNQQFDLSKNTPN